MVWVWVQDWVMTCELPDSQWGRHAKVYSLLEDPAVCTELREYMHSNKWALDLGKVSEFSKGTLVSTASSKYLKHLVNVQMPNGLKHYMDVVLFPCIQLKPGKGISLCTACCWLHAEGFRYIAHKKSLYYNGHDHSDVVDYRQKTFIPTMLRHVPQYTFSRRSQHTYPLRKCSTFRCTRI